MSGLRPALSTLIFLMLITGGAYPLLTTALGQWWFPHHANGSLLREGQVVRGSALIGQHLPWPVIFRDVRLLQQKCPIIQWLQAAAIWRPSNPELDKQLQSRIAALRAANPQANPVVPVELVTASASGLDNNLNTRRGGLANPPRCAGSQPQH